MQDKIKLDKENFVACYKYKVKELSIGGWILTNDTHMVNLAMSKATRSMPMEWNGT